MHHGTVNRGTIRRRRCTYSQVISSANESGASWIGYSSRCLMMLVSPSGEETIFTNIGLLLLHPPGHGDRTPAPRGAGGAASSVVGKAAGQSGSGSPKGRRCGWGFVPFNRSPTEAQDVRRSAQAHFRRPKSSLGQAEAREELTGTKLSPGCPSGCAAPAADLPAPVGGVSADGSANGAVAASASPDRSRKRKRSAEARKRIRGSKATWAKQTGERASRTGDAPSAETSAAAAKGVGRDRRKGRRP